MVAQLDAADVLDMGAYCDARRRDVLAAALGWAPRVHTSHDAALSSGAAPNQSLTKFP